MSSLIPNTIQQNKLHLGSDKVVNIQRLCIQKSPAPLGDHFLPRVSSIHWPSVPTSWSPNHFEERCRLFALLNPFSVSFPLFSSFFTLVGIEYANPHKPPWKITRFTAHFTYALMSELVICKHQYEMGHRWHQMSLPIPGVIKQHKLWTLRWSTYN